MRLQNWTWRAKKKASGRIDNYTRGAMLSMLLLVASTLTGQLSQRFNSEVLLPNGGGTYQISFLAKFTGGTSAGPDGSIIIPKPGKVLLKLQDFKANGPDPAEAEKIRLRLELPASAGGQRLNVSKDSNDRATLSVPAAGRVGLFSKISIIYEEQKIKGGTFDLTRVFSFPVAEVVEKDPVIPPPSDPIVTAPTGNNGNTNGNAAASNEVVKQEVPKEKPQWEKDFEDRNVSAEEYVDTWSHKLDQVDQKRQLRSLIKQKLQLIDLKPSVEEMSNNRYKLTFEYVEDLKLDTIIGGSGYRLEKNKKVLPYGHEIIISVTDAGAYQLQLSDANKENGSRIVSLDNLLGGEFEVLGDSVSFTFRGGVPPYELLFYQKGGLRGQLDIGYDSSRLVSMDQLRDKAGLNLLPGTYTVKLQDQQRTVTWNYNNEEITILKPEPKPVDTKIPLMIGGGLAALVLFLIIKGANRRRRRERIRENLNEGGTSSSKPSPAPASAPPETPVKPTVPEPEAIVSSTPIINEVSGKEIISDTSGKITVPAAGGFRVTRRAKVDNAARDFHPDLRPGDFLPLHLERNWTESRVATVFFNKQSIFVLDDFLRRENTSKIAGSGAVAKDGGWERNEAIPEIGGMLMGQYRLDEDGETYLVSVEEFIPLKAKSQNVVKVQIDPMSLARDLSAAQDAHPELTVIGWFHTHPGHGLFLSQPDLKVQHGQFREPYHFAMEIDSLTENLDTAFFTYLPSGKMNNRDTRRPDSPWFSWSEIEKFTRRNSPN